MGQEVEKGRRGEIPRGAGCRSAGRGGASTTGGLPRRTVEDPSPLSLGRGGAVATQTSRIIESRHEDAMRMLRDAYSGRLRLRVRASASLGQQQLRIPF